MRLQIGRIGPKQVRIIEALADHVDTPGHRRALIYVDSGADGWAVQVGVTEQPTAMIAELKDLGALHRQLLRVSGPGRRASVALASRIKTQAMRVILLLGSSDFTPFFARRMVREFRGDATT